MSANPNAKVKKPVSFDELFPGRFLKAGLFNGKKVTLTIKDIDREELEGDEGKQIKALIFFEETPLALVACKTNGICIKAMFGSSLADWIGKKVTLFPSDWNGEPCIRVWGSPDIEANKEIEVKLPRRRPIPMTLHKVAPKGAPAPAEVAA